MHNVLQRSLVLAVLLVAEQGFAQEPARVRPQPGQQLIKLSVTDGVQVRAKKPPLAFDQKGKPPQLTQQELNQLRSNDPKIPGYAAEYSDLKAGQAVIVYVGRRKPVKESGQGDPTGGAGGQDWIRAGQIQGRLATIDGPEFVKGPKAQVMRKNKAKPREVPRRLTLWADRYQPGKLPVVKPTEKLEDLAVTMILIVDERVTK